MLARVLLAIAEESLARKLRRTLRDREDLVVTQLEAGATGDREAALRAMGRDTYDLVFVDNASTGEAEEMVAAIRALPDPPEIVAICGDDPQQRDRLLAAGCFTALSRQAPSAALREAVAQTLARRRERLSAELTSRRIGPRPRLGDFVSESPSMQAFMAVVRRVVASQTSLLITGETGVGKERLARAIHAEGPRAAGSFVSVNCGALPETLLESELFGHEEGAFTGASRGRRGWFELAHGGTIFLDEIGEMPPHLQVKLLGVLQNHEVQRLGAERTTPVDVRVMAATNRDLAQDSESGRFRRDLYYRLSVVTLTIPPLSQRREDIPSLVDDYLAHFRAQIPTTAAGVTDEAMQALVRYDWPGNVRELVNVIERAVLLAGGDKIALSDLPKAISNKAVFATPSDAGVDAPSDALFPDEWLSLPWREARARLVARYEKAYLDGLLRASGGRIGKAARRAGMEPRSLYEKMRRHGLRKESYRKGEPH